VLIGELPGGHHPAHERVEVRSDFLSKVIAPEDLIPLGYQRRKSLTVFHRVVLRMSRHISYIYHYGSDHMSCGFANTLSARSSGHSAEITVVVFAPKGGRIEFGPRSLVNK
jgi:hypothetical protein